MPTKHLINNCIINKYAHSSELVFGPYEYESFPEETCFLYFFFFKPTAYKQTARLLFAYLFIFNTKT